MIELPRAALTAGQIAGSAEFFSFGTNDLTQMTWGFSRDDVEASFFRTYLEHGIFAVSPFESLDTEGVGALVRTAGEPGREPDPTCTSASAASTAATRTRSTSSRRSGSTTSPARRSGCRWPGWRPAGRARLTAGCDRAATTQRSRPRRTGLERRSKRGGGRRAAQNSADARFCRPASTRGSSLPTAREEAEQVLARLVAVGAGGTPHERRPGG